MYIMKTVNQQHCQNTYVFVYTILYCDVEGRKESLGLNKNDIHSTPCALTVSMKVSYLKAPS